MCWVAKFAERGLGRLSLEQPVRDLLLRVVRIVVLFLFLLLALQNLGIDLLPLLAGLGIVGRGHRARAAGRAGQRRRGPHDHLHAAVPCRRIHLDRRRGRRRRQDLDLQHDAAPQRPLAGRDPEPQDRRRDPAQLRRDPATGPRRQRGVRHRPRRCRRRGPRRSSRAMRACCRIRRRWLPPQRSAITPSRSPSSPGSRCRISAAAAGEINPAVVETFRLQGVQIPVLRVTVSA